MRVEVIPSYEYERQRWKNGLGWTREIAREANAEGGFDWRVSIAEIDHDCGFSAFPGYRRILSLLSGEGIRLQFADGSEHIVPAPHGKIEFDGAESPSCQLIDGATTDFNLMWRPDRIDASFHHRPLIGSMVFFADADSEWLIYVLAGWAAVKEQRGYPRLAAGDSLRLRPDGIGSRRAIVEGAGELFTVKLSRTPPLVP